MSWRSAVAGLLLALCGAPLVLPLRELINPAAWTSLHEFGRVFGLLASTLTLCGLTLALVLPPGIILAVFLFRTDLPGRRWLRGVFALGVFVPLPLFALAWQSVGGGWRPWAQGLLPAAYVHAVAALPWVVWLVGLGLQRIEPEAEEDGLLGAPPWRVVWLISLRLVGPTVALTAAWVALQAAGEIAVTDLAVVRTFAEEVYTQHVAGGPRALGRAVAVSLPGTLLAVLAVGWLLQRGPARPFTAAIRPPITFALGRCRWPGFAGMLAFVAVWAGVPLLGLLRQAGGGDDWSLHRLAIELGRAGRLHWLMVLDSFAWSAVAGLVAASLAQLASWQALDSRAMRRLLFVLAVALWAVPGPILGFGLKEAIEILMKIEDFVLAPTTVRPFRAGFYELSTPLPVLWAHVARLFPYAVAILWPAVRDVPRDLRDAARIDGVTPLGELRHVIFPLTRRAFALAVLAVSALAMGELAASKLVQVPGRQSFVQELFSQMHYAATATTAALGLMQLAPVAFVWTLVAWRWRRLTISSPNKANTEIP